MAQLRSALRVFREYLKELSGENDYARYRSCVGSGHAGAPITPFCMRGWLHRTLIVPGADGWLRGQRPRPSPLGRARRLDGGRRIRSYARRLARPSG